LEAVIRGLLKSVTEDVSRVVEGGVLKCSVNPVINPNPVPHHYDHVTIMHET
jgi:hypothetical protein